MPNGSTETDWRTPAETTHYRTTPDYAETMAFLERLAAAHPDQVRIETFGRTGEGRELRVVIASKDGEFDPAAIHASGRVVLLVQNAIHAGEMDGKDACLALLRDLLHQPEFAHLLEHVVLVFIPVYNIDGHERRSAHSRINQTGPELAGWRANATNLNLNRDYVKAEAPETRAFLRMFHRWMPDFFVDDHVTDGADFQYEVTFAIDDTANVDPAIARWVRETVTPEVARRVNASGHKTFPALVYLKDDSDPAKGLVLHPNPPRFSTGYMILENRPALLVELHMLKEYRARVTSNYEVLRALLEVLHRESAHLVALNREADAAAARLGAGTEPAEPVPLALSTGGGSTPVPFLGYRFTRQLSEVSGTVWVRFGHEPWEVTLPFEPLNKVTTSVVPPAAYIVPPQWTHVIEVLEVHDVRLLRTTAPWTGRVERYRLRGLVWQRAPFEGHHPMFRGEGSVAETADTGTCTLSTETMTFPAGSVVVPLSQRLSKVAVHWLEPEAPDSAVRWGFFDPVFEQKEYGEPYVLETLAREELARDPKLRAEFEHRVESDPSFAGNPTARLEFFFDRSPWGRANRVGEYPVGRLRSLEGLPIP